ncbi:TniQ family protein [Mesorhizobium sp. M0276]|uniref:TniQ family protein n=1 Tax=Mesorhizobium sp. M0276 TaxID=2956928 RepID=UPI00333C26D6
MRFRLPIYDVETFTCATAQPQMPVYLPPAPDEALSSWLLRLAAGMGLPPAVLIRNGFGIRPEVEIWWWRRPTTTQIERVSKRTAVAVEMLVGLTFRGWATARNDEIDERFAPHRFNRNSIQPRGMRPIAICPSCLAEDETPYIRKEWMIGWTSMCLRHRIVLSTHCPACHAKLLLPSLDSSIIPKVGCCQRCGQNLAGHVGEPAREAPLRLQDRLLDYQGSGNGGASGHGCPGLGDGRSDD